MKNSFPSLIYLQSLKKLLLILAAVTFFSCEEEDKFIHPMVHTGEVREITGEGALFYGQVTSGENVEIIDHGFVWDTHSNPGFNNSYKKSLGPTDGGNFNAKVHAGFEEGKTYHMRAFAKTSSAVVYGREVTFISKGGLPFEITEFTPKEALFGDTITISGKHLSAKPGDVNSVSFNHHNSRIIYASDTKIKVIIPESLDSIESKISITKFGRTLTFDESFRLLPPRIVSITPGQGSNNTTVTVHGNGFHINKSFNKVFIDNIELEVIHSTNQLIRFKPVFEIPHGSHLVKVETLGQETIADQYFEKIEPWKKLNAPPLPANSYAFGFMVGDRFFAGNMNSKEFYEYKPNADEWIKKLDIPLFCGNGFGFYSADNIGYMVCILQNSRHMYIYTPDNDSWTHIGTFPGQHKTNMTGFTLDNNLYFGLGFTSSSDPGPAEIWKYEYNANEWTRLNDFPFLEGRLRGFSHKNNGYLVGSLRSIGKFGIAKYDKIADAWELSVDFSSFPNFYAENIGRSIMSFNESVFLITRKSNSTLDIIEYKPELNRFFLIGEAKIRNNYPAFTLFNENNGFIGIVRQNIDEIDFWNFDYNIFLETK